jgi:hypothetical protein
MSGSNSSAPALPASTPPETAEPLGLSVHTMPVPQLEGGARTRSGRLKMILVLLVCAAPVIASYLSYYVVRPGARSNYGELIEPMRSLPSAQALPLTTLQGQPVDPASLRDQWLLVVVADGRCDSVCENLLYAQRQLRESMGKDKDRLDRVWLVTGEAPRPALLPALAQATVLRTEAAAVAQWLQPAAGQPLGAHLYLVDPMGNWMMRFPPQFDPAKVKSDLSRLLRASAFWDTEGRDPARVKPAAPRP